MKKIESGRSMIEMLGVLAIIGVLSIGGLAGYTMAMNRHRANTALDYITKVGITAGTNNATYTDTSCGDIYDTKPSVLATCTVTKATAEGNVTVNVTYASDAVETVVTDRIVSNKIGDVSTTDGKAFTFTM